MKYHFFLLAILSIFLGNCDSCNDDCNSGNLQFNLPVQAYGIKDTLHIGDTIRIKFDIPDELAERNFGHVYDFIDYNFYLVTHMAKIDSLPVTGDSKATFDWTILQGETKYISGAFLIFPEYADNAYHFEALIVPKQKGLFEFSMGSDGNGNRFLPFKKLEGPCSKNAVEVYMKLENDTNVNFEFLKHCPEPVYQNMDRQRFDEYAGFCFYVK